ncbi:MAG: type II secretion system F family protein [Candidatus Aenigmatarchaeota archaeon]
MSRKKRLGKDLTENQKTLIYSALGSVFFVIIGFVAAAVYGNINFLYDFAVISVFVFVLPIFFVKYLHLREIKECEKYFPNFLDDLREAKNSGVSFPQAILNCRGEYSSLNKHVKKLQQDISWEISIDDALMHLRKSMEDSQILSRSISILLETYRSGGNVENILTTLRGSLIKIMESETYRKSLMQQHVMMMYGIFLMYLALIILLGHFLIPMLEDMSASSVSSDLGGMSLMSAASPCESCNDRLCAVLCSFFGVISGMFGFGTEPLPMYYKSLFFCMVMVQGMFTGLLAGQISGKSWVEGLKHGMIMMLLGFIVIMLANMMSLF